MNRYSILTYAAALAYIKRVGHLYDVDQIHPDVLHQLHWAASRGELVRGQESWPLRGGGGVVKTIFTLPKKGPEGPRYLIS